MTLGRKVTRYEQMGKKTKKKTTLGSAEARENDKKIKTNKKRKRKRQKKTIEKNSMKTTAKNNIKTIKKRKIRRPHGVLDPQPS